MSYSERVLSATPPRRTAYILSALALVALILCFSGCVNVAGALADAELYESVNVGHLNDASLHPQARMVARDNADYWAVQAHALGGREPSAETIDRLRLTAGVAPVGS